jgi:hypothetical protein
MFYSPEKETDETASDQSTEILRQFQQDTWLWLKGVVDLHVYCLPCVYMRLFDEIEIAKQFRAFGYRAFVSKRHHCCNADSTKLVMKHVPGIKVYGGVVLNWCVGGLNPHAVDAAILLGAKVIWLGNQHAGTLNKKPFYTKYNVHNLPKDHVLLARKVKDFMVAPPINTIDLDTGELVAEMYDIIDLIAEAGDIILNTCHISYRECEAVVPAAKKAGVDKIMIDHAQNFSVEENKKLVEAGAYLEFDVPKDESMHIKVAEMIRQLGVQHCVITSGHGAITHSHPIDAMRHMMMSLRMHGFSEKEVDMMTKETPAKLLSLDEEPKPWRGFI